MYSNIFSDSTSFALLWSQCLSKLCSLIGQALTRDSVTVTVDAVVYFRIQNATVSVTNVSDAPGSTKLLAQTTLRNMIGTKNLSDILMDREGLSAQMQV